MPTQGDDRSFSVLAIVALVLVLGYWDNAPIELHEATVPTGFMRDIRVEVPAKVFELSKSLLTSGSIRIGEVDVDMGTVNTVTVGGGKLVFDPPARIRYDGPGILNFGTTVTEITVIPDGSALLIDVNRSPIDVKVVTDGN